MCRKMLKIYAHQYIHAGKMIQELGGRLYLSEDEPGDPGRPLTDKDKELLKSQLTDLANTCDELNLKLAARQMKRAISDLPQSSRELECIVSVMEHELEEQLFLFVPAGRAAYYEMNFSASSMPTATTELIKAGNCFAVSENAACIFHAMRATEITLTAVYLCLGLVEPENASKSWGIYCNGIKDEMTKRGKAWHRLAEFQEILTTLVAVKDGWRNNSIHVDAYYSEEDAKRILTVVQFFIEKVSLKMDESGLPRA